LAFEVKMDGVQHMQDYRERAEECLQFAETMTSPEAKAAMVQYGARLGAIRAIPEGSLSKSSRIHFSLPFMQVLGSAD
jgi:hypothetical protein